MWRNRPCVALIYSPLSTDGIFCTTMEEEKSFDTPLEKYEIMRWMKVFYNMLESEATEYI